MNKRAGFRNTRFLGFVLIAILVSALVSFSGCSGTPRSTPPVPSPGLTPAPHAGIPWNEMPLSDLRGRGNFSISRFGGTTVIIPILSVSCPSCIVQLRRQLDEAGRLAAENPGKILVVTLDIDPDNGPDFLTAYGDPAAFTGYSARSPEEMTLDIFRQFGPFAVDTTTTPVIIVCPDGYDQLLPPGLKTAEDLKRMIGREC
ncbi:MAG: hypothetical protein ACYDEZ_06880 [Methanoregula sp.]